MAYDLEIEYKVFNEHGEMVRVMPDLDGLGLVVIEGGADFGRVFFPPELAKIIAKVMIEVATNIENEETKR